MPLDRHSFRAYGYKSSIHLNQLWESWSTSRPYRDPIWRLSGLYKDLVSSFRIVAASYTALVVSLGDSGNDAW